MLAGGTRRAVRWPPRAAGARASGSVVGPLGETGRLGLAADTVGLGRGGGRPPPRHRAPEANPQAGGTVRPNAGSRPAGGGPPMAGHGCQSISVVWKNRGGERLSDKVLRTGGRGAGTHPTLARGGSPPGRMPPRAWAGLNSGALCFRKLGFRNRAKGPLQTVYDLRTLLSR